MRVIKASYRSPNVCAFVERFIQTLGQTRRSRPK